MGRLIGDDLRALKPGSAEAERLKAALIAEGAWSQYLEVGIGPDAEIFTKAQPMSAVGCGADAGFHAHSHWNNPEPEAVLIVASDGRIVGATLGNDVNLRDFEGRSALLLGKAKDQNASAALGPFVRLFDATFSLDDVRAMEISLTIAGEDGFRLEGRSSMREISRDPADLAAQADRPAPRLSRRRGALSRHHVRAGAGPRRAGQGLHPQGRRRRDGRADKLGRLVNRMKHAHDCARWEFGTAALMRHLAKRGVL